MRIKSIIECNNLIIANCHSISDIKSQTCKLYMAFLFALKI